MFHALRIIPPILEICGDIEKLCPEAWVINLSNPLTRICLAISRRYPQLKSVGLNHFSVLLKAAYKNMGRDAYPDIRARAPAYFEALPEESYENLGAAKEMLEAARGSPERLPGRRHVWPERELFLFRAHADERGFPPAFDQRPGDAGGPGEFSG